MAGRPMNKLHQEDVRRKIQTSQLINVLQGHAFGEIEELSASRLKAIEILLRKSVPDVSAITIDGEMKHTVDLVETLKAARDLAG